MTDSAATDSAACQGSPVHMVLQVETFRDLTDHLRIRYTEGFDPNHLFPIRSRGYSGTPRGKCSESPPRGKCSESA
jgi:hypothetical protein